MIDTDLMVQFERLPGPQTLADALELIAVQARMLTTVTVENATLRATIMTLQTQVQALQARLNQTSSNSSKPPSSDPPGHPPRPARSPSGRPRGGQPGHVGQGRSLRSPEQVDRLVELRPVACAHCGALLLGADPSPARHQVTDLPVVRPEVVEYRRHTLTCLACGEPTSAPWPATMPSGAFGPRLQATVGYLTGRLGVSHRETAEALATLTHTPVSLGSIAGLERAVSAALAEPVAAAAAHVQQQPTQNVDETRWREAGRRSWLWVSATALVTVFLVLATRGATGAKHLIGETSAGIVGSDRWSGYTWLDPARRQVCWAHLKRDCQAFVDRGGEPARLGRALLAQVAELFRLWHELRVGTRDRAGFQTAMAPVMIEVGALLREGAASGQGAINGTGATILTVEPALWTFVRVEGVEPTNNGAERPLRRAVLWRRRSFGTQSAEGSRFVERILTAVTTLRQQHRDVLGYLTAACAASIAGDPPPSLLPDPT